MKMDEENKNPEPRKKFEAGDEPSVLDWLKSILSGRPIPIPASTDSEPEEPIISIQEKVVKKEQKARVPSVIRISQFRLPLALLFALMAQFGLEQESGSITISVVLYALAALLIGWAAWSRDFSLIHRPLLPVKMQTPGVRLQFFLVSIGAFLVTFLTAGDNQFNAFTFYPWVLGMVAIVYAFWEGDLPHIRFWQKLRSWSASGGISTRITTSFLLFILAFGLSVFFRVYRISEVPVEMVSDHAEKLLDVVDVLNGQKSIFFPRNTGREALQFYMAVATIKLFGTGISHLTLKIGTVAAGILTLPYIYLLGKEAADEKTGLFAMTLAGIAYWPNVISRIGLRFPLYPLFVAPAMYYLVKGIRRRSLNDFLMMGFFVGAGLHGYSPARVIPIVMAFGVLLYLFHRDASGQRLQVLSYLLAAGIVALVVLTPLARIAVDQPDLVNYRVATRIGTTEQDLPGSATLIFLQNAWDALKMFAWDNGEVWVIGIPGRPALDWVSGALFHLGVAIAIVRFMRKRRWVDLFLLLSIPLLQLPSTLSLAFPGENPATNRAAGAIVPVFFLCGLSLSALVDWMRNEWRSRSATAYSVVIVGLLIFVSARINYNLVFEEYDDLFRRSAWNTTEAGEVIRGFSRSVGIYDNAYVVAFPHWMDTRLVGMNAGKATKDYAIQPDQFSLLREKPGNQLLLLHPDDVDSLSRLEAMFPNGQRLEWTNPLPGKNFNIFFIPSSVATQSAGLPEMDP
jgi:hypothetical protein